MALAMWWRAPLRSSFAEPHNLAVVRELADEHLDIQPLEAVATDSPVPGSPSFSPARWNA
jgi:hypothetical protein